MEYIDIINNAIEKNELNLLLRGDGVYRLETSQYAPGAEPTDVGKVLSKGIYKLYKINPKIKDKMENELLNMLEQTNYDVYIVILYIMSQLFKEKNGLSPFKMNMSLILPKIKNEIKRRSETLKKGIEYPNGFYQKRAWEEIERFKYVCKIQYGIDLF